MYRVEFTTIQMQDFYFNFKSHNKKNIIQRL